MSYEIIDHTADIGIRVKAPDYPTLVREAVRGMFELITDLKKVRVDSRIELEIKGWDETDLLINTLRELLYRFLVKGLAVKNISIYSVNVSSLSALIEGEVFNLEKHGLRHEIKALTYAGGDIRRHDDGLEITVIFDV